MDNKKINDYIILLKHAYHIYGDDESVSNMLKDVYKKYAKMYGDGNLTANNIKKLWMYIQIINNFDESCILSHGEKLLNGK